MSATCYIVIYCCCILNFAHKAKLDWKIKINKKWDISKNFLKVGKECFNGASTFWNGSHAYSSMVR